MEDKFSRQAAQYDFPYHHLVEVAKAQFGRALPWGLDYYNYLRQTGKLVRRYAKTDILDVGCGDGALLYSLRDWLKAAGYKGVGIDIDGKPVKFAQAFAHGHPQLDFSVQDIFSYTRPFGLIICLETLEHIPDGQQAAFAHRLDQLLLPGGILIISVPTTNLSLRPKHFRHYDAAALLTAFPSLQLMEKYYITARRRAGYNLLERLLCGRKLNLSGTRLGGWLLAVNDKFYWQARPETGAHLLAVFRKTQ